jgi:hypothetical protein
VKPEVFEPTTNKSKTFPDPPYEMKYQIIYATFENPNMILVASCIPGEDNYNSSAMIFVYDIRHGSWKMLELAQHKIHLK